eukprot:TRINITY_DN1313_c0_g1_i3.p1 TRINITY_DN1313_c0_g1~~TRINITY_DN1313_c0_g1_i3.p1  ORF type:complete len:373 (-),score=60.02 TRINITY_DN1313_c0_g1_i3:233-1351(-)
MTSTSSALLLPSPSLSRRLPSSGKSLAAYNARRSSVYATFQGQAPRWNQATSMKGRTCKVSAQVGSEVADSTTVKLGKSSVEVTKLGIGAWSWGDTTFWNEGGWDDKKVKAAKGAFDEAVNSGITFFDTAEVYGFKLLGGENSETLLGDFIKYRQRRDDTKVVVATKFAALPWRFGRSSVVAALKDSLNRLGLSSVDLYQIHWPGVWQNDEYVDGLGDAVEQGLVKAVGVSNFNETRLRKAHEQLQKRNIVLASNQVHYSLVYRLPETNGVKRACDDLGITLIAYSPIGQGILSGKYSPENPPTGPRGKIYTREFLIQVRPLLNKLKEVGDKYGKSQVQVSLNWLIAQGNVIPIPGAKSANQASRVLRCSSE